MSGRRAGRSADCAAAPLFVPVTDVEDTVGDGAVDSLLFANLEWPRGVRKNHGKPSGDVKS